MELPINKEYHVVEVPMDLIFSDDSFNCRGKILPIDVLDLAKDIAQRGLDTPITLQPYSGREGKSYRIVAGHRRFMAFRVNNAATIPAFIRTDLDETGARAANLRENLQREQLNMKQEAYALRYFFDSVGTSGKALWNYGELASIFGKSRGWIESRHNLLKLPPEIQDEAAAGTLTASHIKQLLKLKTKDAQFDLVKKIKDIKAAGNKAMVKKVESHREAYKSTARTKSEILEVNTLIYNMVGPGLTTRLGAWCAGEINAIQLFADVRRYCESNGLPYNEPEFVRKALAGVREESLEIKGVPHARAVSKAG